MKARQLKSLIRNYLKEESYFDKVAVEFPEEGKVIYLRPVEMRVLMFEVTRLYYEEGIEAAKRFTDSFIVHSNKDVDSAVMFWRWDIPGKFTSTFDEGFKVEDTFIIKQYDLFS